MKRSKGLVMIGAAFQGKYTCPKCGGRKIVCGAECEAWLENDDDNPGWTIAMPFSATLEPIEESRCKCMKCGHTGYLYMWKVEE